MNSRALAITVLLLLGSVSGIYSNGPPTTLKDLSSTHFTGNTADCGTNASNISFEIDVSAQSYKFGDAYHGALIASCGLWDTTYKFDWNMTVDDSGYWLIADTNMTYETNTSSVSYDPSYTDHYNEQPIDRYYLPDGNFTLHAALYTDDGSGGWNLIASTSDSFSVSEDHSTTACGYNSSLLNVQLTTPSSWNESSSSWELIEDTLPILPNGSNGWGLWMYVECPSYHNWNNISWSLTNLNSSTTVYMFNHNTYVNSMGSPCNGYCNLVANGSMWKYERSVSQFDLSEGQYVFTLNVSNYNDSSSSWEISSEINTTFEVWNVSTIPEGPHTVDDSTLDLELTNTSYDYNDTVIASIEMDDLVIGEEYNMAWWLKDSDENIISDWNVTWVADENSTTEWANFSGLSAGSYCLEAALYVNQDLQYFLRSADECFVITGGDEDDPTVDYDCATPTINATSNETLYDVGELFLFTLVATCPSPNGQNMVIEFWISHDDQGTNTAVATETWESYSNETVVFYYEDAGVTLSGTGNFTLHADYFVEESDGNLANLDYDSDNFLIATTLDDDGDGVTNDMDMCPDTPEGASVNSDGCSILQMDTDGDGVTDLLDACQDTPSGEAVDIYGCSTSQIDEDSDGIMNNMDQCPVTLPGETVDASGCAQSQLDEDSDGAMNDVDECPNTPENETIDSIGCSSSQLDSDADGVTNDADQCPDTAAGESVDAVGCSASQQDTDGDGVPDIIDECPASPSGLNTGADGCNNPPECDISYEDDAGAIVTLESQLVMGAGSSTTSISLPTGNYQFHMECTDPESDMLSMSVSLDGGSAMAFSGSPLSTGAIPVPVEDGMTLSKTISYYWTDGAHSGTYELEVSLIGDDTSDSNAGFLPGFEVWITIFALFGSLFMHRTRRGI